MVHRFFKLFVAAPILFWAITEFYKGNVMNGLSIVFLAGIFIFLYFKNEFLLLVFFQIRKQNIEGAKKWISKIKSPEKALIKSQQAYYYFLQGLITSQDSIRASEKFFRKALSMGLKMKHNIAMAKLNLAGIAMHKRRKREATLLISEAKKLDKHGLLKEQIAMVKQQMKRI